MPFAISVQNVSKIFNIPHDKRTTLKEHFVRLFSRSSYEAFNALQDVSFNVKKGEFLGIIGANGSGKSTLLKSIAGIYSPSSGEVKVDGKISPFLELGVGFDPELSGAENLYLNATVLGLSRKEIDARYRSIVDFAEMERFMDMKVKNYSSGMFVRLAFSVAIQVDADILLMDEVLAVGDTRFQEKCFDVFRRFKEAGKTMILVTHDIGSVRRFCDRCVYLKKGEVTAEGSPEKVIETYLYDQGEVPRTEVVLSVQQEGVETNDEQQDSVKNKKGEEDGGSAAQSAAPGVPPVNKKVHFESWKLIDKNGNESTGFCPGDDVKIKVEFGCGDHALHEVNAGVAIYDEHGNHLFGDRSEWHKVMISCKKGEYELVLKKLPLLSGTYFVTLALDSAGDTEHYDWLDKKIQFNVRNDRLEVGLIHFLTEWHA